MCNDFFLSFIQLGLDRRCDQHLHLRHADSLNIIAGSGEGHLEVAGVGADKRLCRFSAEPINLRRTS